MGLCQRLQCQQGILLLYNVPHDVKENLYALRMVYIF